MCKDLVSIKKIKGVEDVFTNSKIISINTGIGHKNVRELINKYKSKLLEFGNLSVLNVGVIGTSNYEKIYDLNEMQATFLITLMRNSEPVVEFKVKLVKEFYRMRNYLLEKQSKEWLQTRKNGKLTRRKETDNLKLLLEYAIKRGSKTYEKQPNRLYSQYTRLVNSSVGIATGEREVCAWKVLITIQMLEDMIQNTVVEEINKNTEYHNIYKVCKQRCNEMIKYAYLPENRLLK